MLMQSSLVPERTSQAALRILLHTEAQLAEVNGPYESAGSRRRAATIRRKAQGRSGGAEERPEFRFLVLGSVTITHHSPIVLDLLARTVDSSIVCAPAKSEGVTPSNPIKSQPASHLDEKPACNQ